MIKSLTLVTGFPCAKYCTVCFRRHISLNPPQQPSVILSLQIGKLRLGEVKELLKVTYMMLWLNVCVLPKFMR